jgi:predicted transcriptional regulator
MKSVLISIQPKWCEQIANGGKTIEVRKTRPKIETPFKCYIYMTAGNAVYPVTINGSPYTCSNVGGKCVIGEFVCDRIEDMRDVQREPTCLTIDEWLKYTDGHKGIVWGWHISDLVIYDKPKELSEFYRHDTTYDNAFAWAFEDRAKNIPLTRPPQSWCYVEGCVEE